MNSRERDSSRVAVLLPGDPNLTKSTDWSNIDIDINMGIDIDTGINIDINIDELATVDQSEEGIVDLVGSTDHRVTPA